jgi:hypothetical protein
MGRRVKGPIGGDAPYPTGMTGQDIFDTPIADLPPLTPAIRQAWGNGAHPVANAQSLAGLFAGVYDPRHGSPHSKARPRQRRQPTSIVSLKGREGS